MKKKWKQRRATTRKKTTLTVSGIACALVLIGACNTPDSPDIVTISIIGTNDVHGAMLGDAGTGGLLAFSGYVEVVEQLRQDDGGVLLIDAGDMWQGTLESNLSEGASVVQIYNALGYDAAAIGNHEFDFGPAGPKSVPDHPDDDPQGALRKRAAEAEFPLLASNLVDESSGGLLDWENVFPTTMINVAGVNVGIVGAITEHTLSTTIASNTAGIAIAPLAESMAHFARELRAEGAELVIVTVHAGGRCAEFADPDDISSCNPDSEIFRAARAIDPGLVDVIVAGHTHRRVSHRVNGIAIVSSLNSLQTFDRLDIDFDRSNRQIDSVHFFSPQVVCEFIEPTTEACSEDSGVRSQYENSDVIPSAEVAALVSAAVDEIQHFKEQSIGVTVTERFKKASVPDSAIGNLLTTVLLDMSDSADIAIHNTVGGIRADLPAGEITYGDVFQVFPFDNRVVHLEFSGADIIELFRNQVESSFWRAGVAGATISVECGEAGLQVTVTLDDGSVVQDGDWVTVVANDFLATGGDDIFTPVTPPEGFDVPSNTPLFRDQIVQWLTARGGTMSPDDFFDNSSRRYALPDKPPVVCE